MTHSYPRFGAFPQEEGTHFIVWAPHHEHVTIALQPPHASPGVYEMEAGADGMYTRIVPGIGPGARYTYRLASGDFPDPASRFQPDGVHGPSMVVDPGLYDWQDDAWEGIDREELVFYELHVGTFTPEGTFAGVQQRLPHLRDLGVTALQLMPVADFPGRWSWGYDQAALFAPAHAYGTPDDLRRLVDAAHALGLAVFLDVIYNHFGPDGAYAPTYGPYFTNRHHTPWGKAINLDDGGADHVRAFFIDNALHWLREYHLDGLRLDATHALLDDSPQHFLAQLSESVAALPGPPRYLIAEDERNLRTLLDARADGGYGLDGVWADDFHHQMRNLLTGDEEGYFADFAGTTAADLVTTLRQGWFYTGQYAPSHEQARGTDPDGLPLDRFVICIQNHDQVGNRAQGDRLAAAVSAAVYRAASALLLFAPQTPLLFMGQEWGARTPFQYFTDHHDELGRLVSAGRCREFARFAAFGGTVPDPQDPGTFLHSKLDWNECSKPHHARTLRLYRDLLALRPRLHGHAHAQPHGTHALTLQRGTHLLLVALADGQTLPLPGGARTVLHTEQPEYAGAGQPPRIDAPHVHFSKPAALILAL